MLFLPVALTRSETGEKRQRPGARRPRHRGQQPQAHPTQAARLHKMRVRAAHRIPIDAFGLDAFTAATLDGVIDAENNRTSGRKPSEQQAEKETAGFKATPASTIHTKLRSNEWEWQS